MLVIKETLDNAAEIGAEALKNNQVICFATETVYALACDATSDVAVKRLYKIKQRDMKKPIAVFVKNLEAAKEFLNFNEIENKIAENFMPGMITLILNKKIIPNQNIKYRQNIKDGVLISSFLNKNENTLGLRIPDHKFCLELLKNFNGVIAATSANISKEAAAIDFEQVKQYFSDKIDLIIDGGICKNKLSSTVLKVDDDQINILRQGLITKSQILNSL
jgi:L-threonylcarbamoyladenylate synthase